MQESVDGLGDRFRLFLDSNRLSVTDFASQCGIPRNTMQQYIAGRRKPGADHLSKMCEAGIDVAWLLTGKSGQQARLYMPDLPIYENILAADPELAKELFKRAIKIFDNAEENPSGRGGKLWGTELRLKGVCRALRLWRPHFENRPDGIVRLRRDGWETEKIASLFVGSYEPKEDSERGLTVVPTDSADQP